MGRNGYIPALAQSALLQTYGGAGAAVAAQSLADDARTLLQRPEPSKRRLDAVAAPGPTVQMRERTIPVTPVHRAARPTPHHPCRRRGRPCEGA